MRKMLLFICISILMLLTSCGGSEDDVIRREEKKTVDKDEIATGKVQIDYKNLLIDKVNEIYDNATDKIGLGFKLDASSEIPVLYVLYDGVVDKYTYDGVKYECTEKNIDYDMEYNGYQGYFYPHEIIDSIIPYYDKDNIPDFAWATAYDNYTFQCRRAGEYTYSIAYIDEDDIPEVVCKNSKTGNITILCWYRGSVVENELWTSGEVYYNGQENFCLKRNEDEYEIYSIEDGRVIVNQTAKIDDVLNGKADISEIKKIDNDINIIEFNENISCLCLDLDIDEWKKAYIKYIVMELGRNVNDYRYNVMDTDGDGVPELFAIGEWTAAGNVICTYYDGKVYENNLPSGGLYYIQNENKYYSSYGGMDRYYDKIFHIEKGKCVDDCIGEYGLEDYSDVVDENGDLVQYIYKWNNALVSEEGYNTLFREEFDSFNSLSVSGLYDKERILSILTSTY